MSCISNVKPLQNQNSHDNLRQWLRIVFVQQVNNLHRSFQRNDACCKWFSVFNISTAWQLESELTYRSSFVHVRRATESVMIEKFIHRSEPRKPSFLVVCQTTKNTQKKTNSNVFYCDCYWLIYCRISFNTPLTRFNHFSCVFHYFTCWSSGESV